MSLYLCKLWVRFVLVILFYASWWCYVIDQSFDLWSEIVLLKSFSNSLSVLQHKIWWTRKTKKKRPPISQDWTRSHRGNVCRKNFIFFFWNCLSSFFGLYPNLDYHVCCILLILLSDQLPPPPPFFFWDFFFLLKCNDLILKKPVWYFLTDTLIYPLFYMLYTVCSTLWWPGTGRIALCSKVCQQE